MASDRRHWIVMPAAGESQRFKDAGYQTPKHLLRVRYRDYEGSMLAHVISRVPVVFEVVVGVQERTQTDWRGETVVIGRTSGQAESVLRTLRDIPEGDSVTVMDCDTLLTQDDIEEVSALGSRTGYSAAVAVGYDSDLAMSRVDQIPYPTLFAEKRYISPWGMISARAFSEVGELREVLEQVVREHRSAGREPYLSEVLNRYSGLKIAHVVHDWTDWGTPEKLHKSGAEVI